MGAGMMNPSMMMGPMMGLMSPGAMPVVPGPPGRMPQFADPGQYTKWFEAWRRLMDPSIYEERFRAWTGVMADLHGEGTPLVEKAMQPEQYRSWFEAWTRLMNPAQYEHAYKAWMDAMQATKPTPEAE